MVDVIGRARVIVEEYVDQQQAKRAGEKAGKEVAEGVAEGGKDAGKKFGDNLDGVLSKASIGLGIAAGAAIATGVGQALQRDATGKRFAASLGLDASEAAALNQSASEIYKNSWGESFEAVQRGVAATKSSFRDLTGDELTEAAEHAQIFADIFETDVVQAAGVASVAVTQGLAKDAVEAFDLMTAAAQQVPLQFRDELLEAVTEYSQFFHQIGIDGPEAFKLLAEGAALGQYGIDKTGDAIKEFGIRVIDSSASTADAFATLGLDIQTIQDQIAAGGEEGEQAFRDVVTALDSIRDPSEKARVAVELFGTPVEDLGNEKIPVFVDALKNGTEELDNFRGATERAGDTASETFTQQAEGWGRSLNVYLGDVLQRTADADIPNFSQAMEHMGERVGVVIDDIVDKARDLWDWIKKTTTPWDVDVPDAPDISQPRSTRAHGGPVSGLALVGERGPELVRFPTGSYVHNNGDTERMLANAGTRSEVTNLNFYGPTSLSQARREADWARTYGTRFGTAAGAGAL